MLRCMKGLHWKDMHGITRCSWSLSAVVTIWRCCCGACVLHITSLFVWLMGLCNIKRTQHSRVWSLSVVGCLQETSAACTCFVLVLFIVFVWCIANRQIGGGRPPVSVMQEVGQLLTKLLATPGLLILLCYSSSSRQALYTIKVFAPCTLAPACLGWHQPGGSPYHQMHEHFFVVSRVVCLCVCVCLLKASHDAIWSCVCVSCVSTT